MASRAAFRLMLAVLQGTMADLINFWLASASSHACNSLTRCSKMPACVRSDAVGERPPAQLWECHLPVYI